MSKPIVVIWLKGVNLIQENTICAGLRIPRIHLSPQIVHPQNITMKLHLAN